MRKLTLLFWGSIVMFSSCKDDEPITPAVDVAQMVRELKEYTYFKEGSYWVYQDSLTGQLDSQYVYYADEGEALDNNGQKDYWFNCHIYSTRDSFEYHHWFNSTWTSANPYRSKVFRIKTKPGNNVGQTILLEYPVVPGNRLFCGNNDTVISTPIITEFACGDTIYHEVVTVLQESDITTSFRGVYSLAKDVGIVNMKVGLISNWILIRYHLE